MSSINQLTISELEDFFIYKYISGAERVQYWRQPRLGGAGPHAEHDRQRSRLPLRGHQPGCPQPRRHLHPSQGELPAGGCPYHSDAGATTRRHRGPSGVRGGRVKPAVHVGLAAQRRTINRSAVDGARQLRRGHHHQPAQV